MPLAIGGSSAAGLPTYGTLWVDVRDFGAKADNGVTDNSVPFQAAIDHLAAQMQGVTFAAGVVFIPSSPQVYGVTKSVYIDNDNIEVRGEGWGSVVMMLGGKHPVFIVGIRRVESAVVNGVSVPVQIGVSNRPDCFGKLDASAAPAPGSVWGIRTNANSFAQFQGTPISAGVGCVESKVYSDNWGETSLLTMEFCIEPPDGQQFQPYAPIMGLGGFSPVQASPFVVSNAYAPNKLEMTFRTAEMDPYTIRSFTFDLGVAKAPYRVAIQLDLINAAVSAFVNGVQVALGDQSNIFPNSALPFAPGTGLKFATNDHYPFLIGTSGLTGVFGTTTGVDLRVYGLRLSNTIRYQNNGVGQPQVRVDAPTTQVNDAWAYFGNDANTIGYLAGTDNPATAGRVVTVQHGGAVSGGPSSGLFLNAVVPNNTSYNAVRDIHIECGTGYGAAVLVGAVLELTIEGVKAYGGYYGVGSFNMTVNYYVYLSKCDLMGLDSGYYSAFQLMYARDISFDSSGRATVRHLGSGSRWDNVFIGRASPVPECAFKACASDYGGDFLLSNWVVDFEGESFARAAFYCEAHGQIPSTGLNLQNVFVGTVGTSASIVQLKDTGTQNPGLNPCWLKVDNLQAYTGSYLGAIDVDGPLWRGDVTGVALTGPRLYHRQKWGTTTGVQMYEATFTAPPRELYWYAGAPVLQVRSPVEGQYSEWRCVGSGTYGTAVPPTWAGLAPVQSTQNGLAAYVLNQGYLTVALS